MSITSNTIAPSETFVPPPYEEPHIRRQCDELIQEVADRIAPVWPLKDYVAVNPYAGCTELPFMQARSLLRVFSKCETLMPVAYYAEAFRDGQFVQADVQSAIHELKASGIEGLESVTSSKVVAELRVANGFPGTTDALDEQPASGSSIIRSLADHVDRYAELNWSEVIKDEISKHCAAHYDEGQAEWKSPWQNLPLYQAWRSAASLDRNLETLGLPGFRNLVRQLPHTADSAIVYLLRRANVPTRLWTSFLLCQAFSIPGWSAWTKYQSAWSGDEARQDDFAGLLAMRLAYDVAASEAFSIRVKWDSLTSHASASFDAVSSDDSLIRLILLRASEIAHRDSLINQFSRTPGNLHQRRKVAQMVFCIDVRSERIRRNLETLSDDVDTFGFAGFFAMPIKYVSMGETQGTSHVPVLLAPSLTVQETLGDTNSETLLAAMARRTRVRTWRNLWKSFAASATGCFSFVETTGFFSGLKLLMDTIGTHHSGKSAAHDGLNRDQQGKLGPAALDADPDGPNLTEQIALAENLLRNLGLTKDFARLVVFCGHASATTNNPIAAGLDCGACGGHSGKPNAQVAAMLLNRPAVRAGLAEAGIMIDEDTHFLAGVHNTTTDALQFFDLDNVPATHLGDVEELLEIASSASAQTRVERLPVVNSRSTSDLMQRARDWSEVRPEWGLAGNAAFIAAPRWMTQHANLDGRSFLHSYEHQSDADGTVLETIMTAPMIVAHWINMQYYASTVDNQHFGSGHKTIHNIVGRFGILAGNGGDLQTGLPWQSLHTGSQLQHRPMRLQVVIAAPRQKIEAVIGKHELVSNLLTNQWLYLVAFDDGRYYRYAADGSWQSLEAECSTSLVAC